MYSLSGTGASYRPLEYIFRFRLFEQRCLTLMDKMSDENRENAIELMETIVDVWGISSSPLTFAYENKICNVVAHPCSQKSVRKQWYNDLAPDLCPFLKVNKDIILAISKQQSMFTFSSYKV